MARALIVGCGCRGRGLGAALVAEGWQVRGTTRDPAAGPAIERAGIEPAVADPDDLVSVYGLIADVALVYWLLGSAQPRAVNGERLEALFEKLVDTPVRGVVYEAAGSAPAEHLEAGVEVARAAAGRWRIPVEVVTADPQDVDGWREAMRAAGERALFER